MRYKCIASPDCMKTFEYGHALRAHVASCDWAKKILKQRADIERIEFSIGIDSPSINGIKGNKYFPCFYSLDRTLKYNFKDRFRFGPLESEYYANDATPLPKMPRRVIKAVSSNVLSSTQIKTVMQHPE